MENDDLYTKLPFCIYEIEKFIFYTITYVLKHFPIKKRIPTISDH